MARFGSSVTVFAKSSEILGKEDREAAAIVRKQLEADGVTFLLDVQYHLISSGGPEGLEIHVQLQKVGKRVRHRLDNSWIHACLDVCFFGVHGLCARISGRKRGQLGIMPSYSFCHQKHKAEGGSGDDNYHDDNSLFVKDVA